MAYSLAPWRWHLTTWFLLANCLCAGWAGELRVPAFTAYTLPDADAARISERRGVTRWTDPRVSVNWYGQFKNTGALSAKVLVRLPKDRVAKFRFTCAGTSKEAQTTGQGAEQAVAVDFGEFALSATGYQRLQLETRQSRGEEFGDVEALLLDGPAVQDAHFNLKERRNAASVHMNYPLPAGEKIQWFYQEVTGVEDPVCTFYMACGFHRGYFGMQVNSPTERRIIFSVWDSGNEGVDRAKVAATNRVQLVAKGEGVDAGDFGNEGTGGHSHLVYPWKTGSVQKFLLGAKPVDETHTVYAGYWWHPERQAWMLISAMNAPHDGGWLKRLHAFSENFWGSTGHIQRKALYGNQWIRTADGRWLELTAATFSHDPTGKADRLDRFMGVENGQFFLSHGGFVEGFTTFGQRFERQAAGTPPAGPLPEIPAQ